MARAALIAFVATGQPFDCTTTTRTLPAYGGPPTTVLVPPDAGGTVSVAAYGAPAPPPTASVDIGPITPTTEAGAPALKDAGPKDSGHMTMAPMYGLAPPRR
jgi:hypothetical protein